jgi:xylose isomerase
MPDQILIVLVKNGAFVGSASKNPFHFHHYDVTNIVLMNIKFNIIRNHLQWIALYPLKIQELMIQYC